MDDPFGHGTCVATVAVDEAFGVADKADLVAIRMPMTKKIVGEIEEARFHTSSVMDAFRLILQDVRQRKAHGGGIAKSVINMSLTKKGGVTAP